MKKRAVIIFLVSSLGYLAKAQVPTWSVTPSSFTYGMTVTAEISVACQALANPSNLIGAFVGTECRGIVNASNIIQGKYVAFLTVRSNTVSGETIAFKIYDATLNVVHDATTKILFQDGASYGFPTIPYPILTNNQPTDITLSAVTVNENLSNPTVGTLTTTDIDLGSTYSYAFVEGSGDTDNAKFTIVGDQLIVNGTLDYETKSSYTVRIATNDSGCSFEKQFSIEVNDVNEAPTGIALLGNTINENSPPGTIIGNFSTTDEDATDTHTYALVAGDGAINNSSFMITPTGELKSSQVFNYELEDTLYLRVKTTDAGLLTTEKSFMVLVVNLNETPTDITMNTNYFKENIPLGTSIIALSSTDQDANEVHTYSFNADQISDNALFTIVGDSILTGALFNYEVKNVYNLRISTRDNGGGIYIRQLIIQVLDANDVPTAIYLSNATTYEDATVGTFLGQFSSEDEDVVDSYTYSFVAGNGDADNASFTVSNDSLFTNELFDVNVQNGYTIRIKSEDLGFLAAEEVFTIFINNSNNPPTSIHLSNNEIDEHLFAGTIIGDLTTSDVDTGDVFQYHLIAGVGADDNANFSINGNVLVINLEANYEVKNSYSILLLTTDGNGGDYSQVVTIHILNVNEAPVLRDTTFFVTENTGLGEVIGVMPSTDVDVGDAHTFSLITAGEFEMVDRNLIIRNVKLDYEVKSAYTVYVVVKDVGGLTDTAAVKLIVNDKIEEALPLPVNKILSPNGDGKNDFFWIDNVSIYSDYSLTVFNSSGHVIYEIAKNYDNSWDGTYHGNEIEQGVCYYLLKSNTYSSIFYKGIISIIKE
jgi:gliding motility-associated-like protein